MVGALLTTGILTAFWEFVEQSGLQLVLLVWGKNGGEEWSLGLLLVEVLDVGKG